VTDLALFRRRNGVLELDRVAPGFTPEEVLALTDLDAAVAPSAVSSSHH
jgi:acyl CoA:acetate/3-ketoacid CoA transferase beta subunit